MSGVRKSTQAGAGSRAEARAGSRAEARAVVRAPPMRFTRWRRMVQVGVALLYLALPVLHRLGFWSVKGNLASLDLGPVNLVEPAAGASTVLAVRAAGWSLLLGMLPVVVLLLVLGPVFCSWVCPWGLISESLDRLRHRRRPWPADAFVRARRPRWIALTTLALLTVLVAAPVAALISPPRLITTLPFEAIFLGVLSPVTGGLLLGLLVLELAGPRRIWCRALCPVGALANYLRTPRTLTIRADMDRCRCPRTPLCQVTCAWGIDPRRMRLHDGCTSCLACVEGCPSGALKPGFGFGRSRDGKGAPRGEHDAHPKAD